MEIKGYSGGLCRFTSVRPPVSSGKCGSPLPLNLPQRKIYAPILGRQGEGRDLFLHLLILSCLQLTIIFMPK